MSDTITQRLREWRNADALLQDAYRALRVADATMHRHRDIVEHLVRASGWMDDSDKRERFVRVDGDVYRIRWHEVLPGGGSGVSISVVSVEEP